LSAEAQISVINVALRDVPKSVKYSGRLQTAQRWTDADGDKLLLTTETGVFRNPSIKHGYDDGRDAELSAYLYILKGSAKLLWRVQDFTHDCPVDPAATFNNVKPFITDLDNNGHVEVWLVYRVSCKGDVSPSEMKVIMYDGAAKYAMRGRTRVKYANDGGEYKFDQRFLSGLKVFRDYAIGLWNKTVEETF
jgi:hypothetical protein